MEEDNLKLYRGRKKERQKEGQWKNKELRLSNSLPRMRLKIDDGHTSSLLRKIQSRDSHASDWDGDNEADEDDNDSHRRRTLHLLSFPVYKNGDNKSTTTENTNFEISNEKEISPVKTRSESKRVTDFICYVCQQPYKQPRILPCLHTFCSDCIINFKTHLGNQKRSASDWLISDESRKSAENLALPYLDGRDSDAFTTPSRFSLDSRKSEILEKSPIFFRGRSKHAKLIENCVRRSNSYSDNGFETKNKPTGATRSSSALSLSRSTFGHNNAITNQTRNKSQSGSFPSKHPNNHIHYDTHDMADNRNDDGKFRTIMCPICLKDANISDSLEDLPRNFMVERLVARDISNQSKSLTECNLCSKKKKYSDGDKDEPIGQYKVTIRCTDCKFNLCSHCASVHRLQKKTKRHHLINLASPRNSQSSDYSELSSASETFTTEINSLSESMIAIPEYIETERNKMKTNQKKGKNASHSNRSRGLKSITRLKLPNLHRFHKLFKGNMDTSQTPSSKEKHRKVKDKQEDDKFKNGLINDGFDDRHMKVRNGTNNSETKAKLNIHSKNRLNSSSLRELRMDTSEGNVFRMAKLENEKFNTNERPRSLSSDTRTSRKPVDDVTHPMMCSKHPNEELKMFCVDCDLCVCRECVVRIHIEHECQLVTRHLFKGQMEEMDNLIREVVPSMQHVDNQITSLSEVKATVESSVARVRQEINEFMDMYVDAIQKQREILLRQVSTLMEDRDQMLGVSRLHLLHMRNEVERTCHFVSDLVVSASDKEILAMKGLVIERLKDLKNMEVKMPPDLSADFRFNPNAKGEIINNFQMFGKVVVAKQPCPSKSFFSVDGLGNANMHVPCSSLVTVCDAEGCLHTGSDTAIRAWVISQENSGRDIPLHVGHTKGGARTLTFTPMDKGYHFLHVTILGCALRNSPYKFYVKRRGRRHVGIWHCCSYCHGEVKSQINIMCGCGSIGKIGYPGCYHGNPDHPGSFHWSCCGQTSRESSCDQKKGQSRSLSDRRVRQVKL